MKKKKILKVLLILFLIIFSWFAYSKYFKKNKSLLSKQLNITTEIDEETVYNSNIIKDINYTSRDLKGNEYILIAKEGEIDLDNSDIIFLTNVTAYIKLIKNSELIVITSNYGKYNTINYDTIFSKQVNPTTNTKEDTIYNSNIIKDINYTSRDLKGNEYILVAKEGEIDLNNSDIIFLTDVTAYIKLVKNSELIVITSNYGKYNTINYDTIFSKNVKIDYVDNIITGDYLDFSMMKNLLIVSRNVVYKNLENTMRADVIELDTTTKDTKIFMYNSNEQVNVTNIK